MATRCLSRSLLTKLSFSLSTAPRHSLHRLRPISAAAFTAPLRHLPPSTILLRGFSTDSTSSSSSPDDTQPKKHKRSSKDDISLEGCDFKHWLVMMQSPEGGATRDEIIDSYVKTLAMVVGSEEEARMKIYSVSTRCYYAFGALVPQELSDKLKGLPKVQLVIPDSYLDPRTQDYGGEPFIDGKAVPYDPKYHAEWMKNQAEAAKKKKDENPESEKPKVSQRRHLLNRDIPSKDPPKNGAPNTGGMPENSELNMEGMSQNSESNIGEMPLNPADGGNAAEDEGMEQNDMGGMPANNMGGVAQN